MSVAVLTSRLSLAEQIKTHLVAQITSGVLAPGDRLVELKIAAEMQTSQAPVREALRELEAIGAVETRRNRGSRVRIISDAEHQEMYEVRAQLEVFAARRVAEAKAPVKEELMQCIQKMRKAAHAQDFLEYAKHNFMFHRHVVTAAGNSVLLEVWENLNIPLRSVFNLSRADRDLELLAESHLLIVDAIAAGDPELAAKVTDAHVLDNSPQGNI
ncbi:MAG: GntR family transcriptional regulator [Alphaproteobacteria bacterium]